MDFFADPGQTLFGTVRTLRLHVHMTPHDEHAAKMYRSYGRVLATVPYGDDKVDITLGDLAKVSRLSGQKGRLFWGYSAEPLYAIRTAVWTGLSKLITDWRDRAASQQGRVAVK